MSKVKKILVAVIAYNEEDNIRNTLRQLKDISYDIILIDDGSSDNTSNIAKDEGINVIRHCVNTNNAMATVSTYLSYAYRNGYDVVCQFDGDGQHIASELHKIVNPILQGEADYVIGSRFLEKKGFQSFLLRRLGIKFFSWIDSAIIGQNITDITSGFRGYSFKVCEYFDMQYRNELVDTSQLLLLSYFMGAKIKEVPVKMLPREHGVSEFTFLRSILFPLKGIVCVIGVLLLQVANKWK